MAKKNGNGNGDQISGGVIGPSAPRMGYTAAPPGMPVRPTGAHPTPRHRLAAAQPFRATAPGPVAFIRLPKRLSYWLNNQHGCCVTTEEAFAEACSGRWIEDRTVGTWAQQRGVLDGAFLDQVLDWMLQDGFHQDGNVYGVGEKSIIDYTNAPALQAAIAEGPVKIGVASQQLQATVGAANGWFGTGFRQDQNLDHCVSLCGYGTASEIAAWLGVTIPRGIDPERPGFALFTWDTVGYIDHPSLTAITGEAWARHPSTVVHGTAPPQPVEVFTPAPTPPPPPPPPPPGGLSFTLATALPAGQYLLGSSAGDLLVPQVIPPGSYSVHRPQAQAAGAGGILRCLLPFVGAVLSGQPAPEALVALLACLEGSGDSSCADAAQELRNVRIARH